ncbi:TonB-dependent receptor [Proteobacteria bacterium 005FR1]|nr:TonB-dependent receptor [Proteobacteria bacterium 005FR1]
MKTKALALAIAACGAWVPVHAQHQHDHEHEIEEIIVTSAQNKTRAQTALPIDVLSGEALSRNAAATLGETIKNTVGVHSTSFGAGVGQPVIRGLSGNRVTVLQNNLHTLDASGASQDHASSVEALLAERIEILRGPATLLYGDAAIGGVVNVIDNRIPNEVPAATQGAVELRSSTVDSGEVGVLRFDGGAGKFAWHLDGVYRQSDDYDIPGRAVDEAALEALAHAHEEEHAQEEAGHEELENTKGFVANSSTESQSLTGGASWVGGRGFIGLAINRLENDYGLPPGAHGAHGHEGVHEENLAEQTHELEHGDEVRIEMEQTRVDLESGLELDGFLESLNMQLSSNRYEHREVFGPEVGTVFENDGLEGRFTANHGGPEGWSGVIGLQVTDRDFSAIGEESFIPQSDIRSAGLFVMESLERGDFIYEFGARVGRQSIETRGACDQSETTLSASAASIWNYREDSNLSLALSHAQRAPTVEELYSNVDAAICATASDPESWVEHAATARIELGHADLDVEVANNLEIGWHKHLGDLKAEVNLFYNQYHDFIYLSDVGEFEETVVSRYLQDDATFKGIEAQIAFPLLRFSEKQHLGLSLFGDYVDAELDSGENKGDDLPRIPPARLGFELAYAHQDWLARLRTTAVNEQDKVAEGELPTDSYTRVDAYLDYHLPLQNQELIVFVKGLNLLDEEIRDHTSFLKHYAPAPGRSFELGLRYRF